MFGNKVSERTGNESGAAIIIAIFALVFLTVVTTIVLTTSLSESNRAASNLSVQRAEAAAAAGLGVGVQEVVAAPAAPASAYDVVLRLSDVCSNPNSYSSNCALNAVGTTRNPATNTCSAPWNPSSSNCVYAPSACSSSTPESAWTSVSTDAVENRANQEAAWCYTVECPVAVSRLADRIAANNTPANDFCPSDKRTVRVLSRTRSSNSAGTGTSFSKTYTYANASATVVVLPGIAEIAAMPPDAGVPVISISAPVNNSSTSATSVTLTYTATDNVTPGDLLNCDKDSGSSQALAMGANTITVNCTDAANNTGTASVSVTRVAPSNYIYVGNGSSPYSITRFNLDGTNRVDLITGLASLPTDIAVNSSYIYWVNQGAAIARANIDGTGVNLNFISGQGAVNTVEVDANYIYWSDGMFHTIGRANLSGTGVTPTFISGPDWGYGLAINANYIYWSEPFFDDGAGYAGRIGRANLNGTGVNLSFIVGTYFQESYGIAVDANYIYWANWGIFYGAIGTSIGRANLNGTSPNMNFVASGNHPLTVAVDSNYVYWTHAGIIGRSNINGASPNLNFITGVPSAQGLAVVGP